MDAPLIAIVGDAAPGRIYDPPMKDAVKAKAAAEALGAELAKRGMRLLVYGGPYLEADAVRGFVLARPGRERSIQMWYSSGHPPEPFAEEATHPHLFERRSDPGADWKLAFYRSILEADGIVLIGGGDTTKISGLVAIGARKPILALEEFGGGAAKVRTMLSPGESLATRDEINLMARPWTGGSAVACVDALVDQIDRRLLAGGPPAWLYPVLAAGLFLAALAIVPSVWGGNSPAVWALFLAPLLAGGAGAAIRVMMDRLRGARGAMPAVIAMVTLGMVAGGMAGLLFVTAQLTASPAVAEEANLLRYAQRSLPYAVGVGFAAGLAFDTLFGRLMQLEVLRLGGSAGATAWGRVP